MSSSGAAMAAAAPARLLRSGPPVEAASDIVAAVRAVFAPPDDQLDYAQAKLALDKIVDPSLDVAATMAELHRMAEEARRLAGLSPSEGELLNGLRKLIYESGPWNGHRPFAYDHSDPFGDYILNKLLHGYLARKLGNCISMPVLFLILADKLGLNVALIAAAEHVLLRYSDPAGRVFNLEATSGAHPARTQWYREFLPMSDRAIASGLYMRTLTRREGIALMATTIVEHLRAEGRHEDVIAVCGMILEQDPRAGVVMVIQGSAYGALLQREFEKKYPVPFLIPEHLRFRRLMLIERNNSLIQAAEALGWEPGEYSNCEIEQQRRETCS